MVSPNWHLVNDVGKSDSLVQQRYTEAAPQPERIGTICTVDMRSCFGCLDLPRVP